MGSQLGQPGPWGPSCQAGFPANHTGNPANFLCYWEPSCILIYQITLACMLQQGDEVAYSRT